MSLAGEDGNADKTDDYLWSLGRSWLSLEESNSIILSVSLPAVLTSQLLLLASLLHY